MTENPLNPDPKLRALQRREARARRTRKIRRGVAAGALTLFVAFFSTIYTQTSGGHATSTSAPTAVTTHQS